MTLTPKEWAILTGQVGRSDDLESAIKRALDDSQRIATVPVTQETSDGAKHVVGHAQIYREGENVLATFNIQSSSLSKHLGGTLGPFSIGMHIEPAPAFPTTDVFVKAVEDTEQRRELQEMGDAVIADIIESGLRHRNFITSQDQNICTDPDCTYYEPHKHGFACTKDCHCNRHGRVD